MDRKYGYGMWDCKGKDNLSSGMDFCRNTSLLPPLQLSALVKIFNQKEKSFLIKKNDKNDSLVY